MLRLGRIKSMARAPAKSSDVVMIKMSRSPARIGIYEG